MNGLTLAIAAILPLDAGVIRSRVDVLETNHVFDYETARYSFTQILFWCDGEIAAWRLVKNPTHWPMKDQATGEWHLIWNDGQVLRDVRARSWRETWEQGDVEVYRRSIVPESCRKGLRATEARP